MKKIVALVLFIWFTGSLVSAQSFHVGLKAGTDIQKIEGASFNDKYAFGYHVGAFAKLSIVNSFSFQPELYYSSVSMDTAQGFSGLYQSAGIPKVNFGYINVPLLLNIKFAKFFSFQIGPKFSLLASKNLNAATDGKSAIKIGDISGVAGVQFNFLKFSAYARYQMGLNNLNDMSSESWKSQVIHVGVGLNVL